MFQKLIHIKCEKTTTKYNDTGLTIYTAIYMSAYRCGVDRFAKHCFGKKKHGPCHPLDITHRKIVITDERFLIVGMFTSSTSNTTLM